ncbi:hypothetical protein RRF57_002651 [Xylaria bambusicola]|uniref:Uncharacterized protein n=1 Tax=Xylaria bambusicola TaxID=326684 RepID=A0AAN7UKL4_9PEZI
MQGTQEPQCQEDLGGRPPRQSEQPGDRPDNRNQRPCLAMPSGIIPSIPYSQPQSAQQPHGTDEPSASRSISESDEQPSEGVLILGYAMYTEPEVRRRLTQYGIIAGSALGSEYHGPIMPPFPPSSTAKELAELGDLDPFPYYVDPFGLVIQLGDVGYYGLNAVYLLSR